MCWASTSSAPGRKISGSSSPSSIASSAARASRYSKRLPGTMMPLRRLVEPVVGAADPLEQARRLPLGAPIWMTRSTSPQSMPRSRLAVATSPRSLPAAIAASTLRRASTARLPWWMPIGSALSLTAHRSWKISSARLRVLQKTRVVLCCSISSITSRAAWRPEWPRPRDLVLGDQDREVGLGAGIADDQVDQLHVGVGREPAAIGVGVADRRRQADPAQAGRERLQPRHRQRQQVAALLLGEGVELVDDDRPQTLEHQRAVGIAQQQAQRFGRGQQHLRRPHPLARLAVRRRVAGAGLDPDRQAHLLDRADQVALDVDRERLQRRDVEGVQALRPGCSASSQMVGRKPASVLPAPVAATSSALRPARASVEHLELVPARRASPWRRTSRSTTCGKRSSLRGRRSPRAGAAPRPGRARAVACSVRPVLPRRAAAHHQPDQHDQQDRPGRRFRMMPPRSDSSMLASPQPGTVRRFSPI